MDLDLFFFLLAMLSCAVTVARAVPMMRQRGPVAGWVVVCILILAVGGVAKVAFPADAGWVAGTLWGVFIAVPSFLSRVVLRRALGQQYKQAARYAQMVCWLHPFDGWRQTPEYYRTLALAQAGERDRAATLLHELIARPGTPAQIASPASAYLYRMQGRWDELLAWTGAAFARRDPSMMAMRVRALGETGRLSEMLSAFQAGRAHLERLPQSAFLHSCQLFLLAFGGREAAVEGLLEGPLSSFAPGNRAFWRATARMAAGQPEARADLRELAAQSDDLELRHAIERRLTRDLANAEATLSSAEKAALDGIEAEITRDRAYHPRANAGLRRAYATCAIILLNLGVFVLETIRGGSENLRTLSRLGALWAPAVLEGGQWYRLVTALFLHLGQVHLFMNLLALMFIGPWVEKTLGWARYLAVYFVSGIGSMAVVVLLIQWGWMREEMLVGASGAIMGLIGATGALLLAGRLRERSALAGKRLLEVLLIVAVQAVFDVLTPQVSFAAHASGVVIGFLATALLIFAAPSLAAGRRQSIAPSPPGR